MFTPRDSTQKPLPLLERIIKTSSNQNDVLLDAFCGCGTALVAAQNLNRPRGTAGALGPRGKTGMAGKRRPKGITGPHQQDRAFEVMEERFADVFRQMDIQLWCIAQMQIQLDALTKRTARANPA